MEQTAGISSDESSPEDNMHAQHAEVLNVHKSPLSVPDIVNGCDGSLHVELMEKDTTFHYLKIEKNLEPEDLINNNKDEFEQDCSDIPKEIDTSEGDFSSAITKSIADERDSLVVDQEACCSTFTANNSKNKEHFETQPREVSSTNTKTGIQRNNKRRRSKRKPGCGDLCDKTQSLGQKVQELFKVDLLKQNSSTGNISKKLEPSITHHQNDKIMLDEICSESVDGDCYVKNDLSTHFNEDRTLSTDSPGRHLTAIKAQESKATLEESGTYINPGTCIKSGKRKLESSPKCLDLLVNGTRQWEPTLKNSQSFSKNQDDLEKYFKNGYQPFGTRLAPADDSKLLSDEIGLVAEENIYENEERRDREHIDHFMPYSSSEDRIDPRKERHRYVSDKLDPDVLQLLEMHLRKQQLVDIKEEGEEELLDLHINKEKSHTETYKGFRNVAPVLDIVLEEPELEHSSDILEEEDSRTSSDIDSDDGSNICAMEQGLMEALQNDLISKTSKIDKYEIATILQGASADIALGEHNNKLKHNDTEAKEMCRQVQEVKKLSDLQTTQALATDKADIASGRKTEGYVDNVETQLPKQFVDTFTKSELPDALDNNEQLSEKNKLEPDGVGVCSQSGKQLNNKKVDLSSCVSKQRNHNCELNSYTISSAVDIGFEPQAAEPFTEQKSDVSDKLSTGYQEPRNTESTTGTEASCPFSYNSIKSNNIEKKISPPDSDFCVSENPSLVIQDAAETEPLERETSLTDQDTYIKVNVDSCSETSSSRQSLELSAEANALQINLENKILSLLEKARAADFRSSHLQAEAEHLLQESKKLRSECKSLSEEAAELLSIFSQQGIECRHRIEQGALKKTHEKEEQGTSETKLRKLETLICTKKVNTEVINPRTTKKIFCVESRQGEDNLQLLSQKYSFLREEGPEIIRELHSLQKDLKNLSQVQNKPVHALYNMLWGGLIAGGTMLLVWWSTKQLG